MEFFDKLGKKATEAYKVTADKTGKLAKETKLKFKIGELKTQVNDLYEEIGKMVYEKHVREENIDIKEDLEEECTKIDVLSDEIEDLLQQCLVLKNKKQCPNCYKELAKEDKFCPNCGEKQDEEQEVEEDDEYDELEQLEIEEVEEYEEQDDENDEIEVEIYEEDNEEEIEENDNDEDEEEKQKTNLERTVEIESDVETDEDEENK